MRAFALEGIGEVRAGDDLAALVARADLEEGDIVCITSKVVSKAEGRVRRAERADAVDEVTRRVVARRGGTMIVENDLGLVMAAGGVDASNTEAGTVLLLPEDPDATARAIRSRLPVNAAVVITDTAGRAWREGQTDIAVGAAGLEVLQSFAGREDDYGNPLVVTAPAVADELAGLAELVSGKLGRRPVVVVRGLGHLVLPAGTDGPGARALIRDRARDMFALGTREAVVAAVAGRDAELFGAPADADDLLAALASCDISAEVAGEEIRVPDADLPRAAPIAFAFGWRPSPPRSFRRP